MNEVTHRFIEVYTRLLSENRIGGPKDFASKIKVSTSLITEIIKGRSNVGISAIQNTVIYFSINPRWIFTGRGDMYDNNTISESPAHYDKAIVDTQRETIDAQRKYISFLESEVERLRDEKKKPAESGQKKKDCIIRYMQNHYRTAKSIRGQ